MAETVYSARPELADPVGFVRRALADLRQSALIGWRLFKAGLRARHRRSLLGYLWLLLPAAAATLICVYLQSRRIFDVAPTPLPYAVHVLAGMVLWQTFVDALNAPLQQLQAGRQMITRSRVPHEAVMLSGLFEVGLNGLVRLAVLGAALAAFGIAPAASVALLPLGMLALVLLGFVFGLLAAPWGLIFDDVRQGLLVLTGFWFFLTPIVYPAPDSGWLRLNPVTPILEATRTWIVEPAASSGFFIVTAGAFLMLVGAWLLYRLARPHAVARLG